MSLSGACGSGPPPQVSIATDTGTTVRWRRSGEIREAGIAQPGFARLALAVFPKGGPWDVPGPNHAARRLS